MGCFSLGMLEQLLIWLVIICAVIAIIKLLLIPLVLSPMGQPGAIIIQVVNIIVWVIVAIAIIYIVFDLLQCAIGGGFGLHGGRY
jgi:hypothetical protein